MGMCNVVAGLIRKTMSRAFVPDCELGIQTKNLTGRNVTLGHVTYSRRRCTRDAIMAKILINLYQWTWVNLKIDWICCYSCNLRLICASMQATRLQWNSEESNQQLVAAITTMATCPAAQVLSP